MYMYIYTYKHIHINIYKCVCNHRDGAHVRSGESIYVHTNMCIYIYRVNPTFGLSRARGHRATLFGPDGLSQTRWCLLRFSWVNPINLGITLNPEG